MSYVLIEWPDPTAHMVSVWTASSWENHCVRVGNTRYREITRSESLDELIALGKLMEGWKYGREVTVIT